MTDHQEDFDTCYAIEDDRAALECLKELVRTAEGPCAPKLVLLTQVGCVPCEEESALRKDDIASGLIQELSVDTEEGLKVAATNDIEYFPALVLLDCNNKLILPSV